MVQIGILEPIMLSLIVLVSLIEDDPMLDVLDEDNEGRILVTR